MAIESITFNTKSNKITVEYIDGATEDFTSAEKYLAKFPNRQADAEAVWPTKGE